MLDDRVVNILFLFLCVLLFLAYANRKISTCIVGSKPPSEETILPLFLKHIMDKKEDKRKVGGNTAIQSALFPMQEISTYEELEKMKQSNLTLDQKHEKERLEIRFLVLPDNSIKTQQWLKLSKELYPKWPPGVVEKEGLPKVQHEWAEKVQEGLQQNIDAIINVDQKKELNFNKRINNYVGEVINLSDFIKYQSLDTPYGYILRNLIANYWDLLVNGSQYHNEQAEADEEVKMLEAKNPKEVKKLTEERKKRLEARLAEEAAIADADKNIFQKGQDAKDQIDEMKSAAEDMKNALGKFNVKETIGSARRKAVMHLDTLGKGVKELGSSKVMMKRLMIALKVVAGVGATGAAVVTGGIPWDTIFSLLFFLSSLSNFISELAKFRGAVKIIAEENSKYAGIVMNELMDKLDISSIVTENLKEFRMIVSTRTMGVPTLGLIQEKANALLASAATPFGDLASIAAPNDMGAISISFELLGITLINHPDQAKNIGKTLFIKGMNAYYLMKPDMREMIENESYRVEKLSLFIEHAHSKLPGPMQAMFDKNTLVGIISNQLDQVDEFLRIFLLISHLSQITGNPLSLPQPITES